MVRDHLTRRNIMAKGINSHRKEVKKPKKKDTPGQIQPAPKK